MVAKTLIAAEDEICFKMNRLVAHRSNCYELFGFDVLVDTNLRPWLLEVNVSPSLVAGAPIDQRVKGMLMSDIFHLIGLLPSSKDSTV